ncbi:MAG: CRISPR system precrRNA processing endoribonuclease RAMP protein Cas6 [Desulfatiglandales bacterium]
MPINNKGNVIRGALGDGLKSTVCVNRALRLCQGCGLAPSCCYSVIFSPSNLVDIKRIRTTQRGFVIKPPLDKTEVYNTSKPLVFDLVLIGSHRASLPWFIVALSKIGNRGIGLNRGKFWIEDIEAWDAKDFVSIYDRNSKIVENRAFVLRADDLTQKMDQNLRELTITFLTPTRIKYNESGLKGGSSVVKDPEFHHIIRRLIDRLNALSILYCGGSLDIDNKMLLSDAMGIEKKASELNWYHRTRKSSTSLDRQGGKAIHHQSGFVGKITFRGNLLSFLPFLLLGQYIHIGEDTTFGHGWYRVES